jgi:hypothetical protein
MRRTIRGLLQLPEPACKPEFPKESETFLQLRFDSSIRVWYPDRLLEGLAVHHQVRWVLRCQLFVTLAAGGAGWAVGRVLMRPFPRCSVVASQWQAPGLTCGEPCGHREQAGADARKGVSCPGGGRGLQVCGNPSAVSPGLQELRTARALPLFLAYAATIVVYWMALLRQQ